MRFLITGLLFLSASGTLHLHAQPLRTQPLRNQTLRTQPLRARIKIDTERQTGVIDPLLYGNFTEHLGRCIYGGIYDPSSPQADSAGFRKDVIAAVKDLRVSAVRWPGGNFVSGYHWMDGIGPKDSRPKRKDLAWGDTEPNQVGTDEFMKFSRSAGFEPYVCVNMGTGSLDEMRNWVEYCNAPTGLYYSDLRANNGHPEPYHVKFWGLGNEVDGEWQIGHLSAEDYAKKAMEAAKLMKWSDSSIRLIASGSSNYGADWMYWNRTILNSLHDYIDYISLHFYAGNRANDHYRFMASTTDVENVINITSGLINEVKTRFNTKKPVYIAFDEYNVWYRAMGDKKLEERYNLQDALVVALFLNTFIRHANVVKMANLAQLVNVIAPMMITDGQLWKQTTWYPLQLFSTLSRGISLENFVECDKYDAGEYKQVPYLDISTVYNRAAHELILNVVNRHKEKAIETAIINETGKLGQTARVYEVDGNDLADENSLTRTSVKTAERTLVLNGNTFTYSFPAHSFTVLRLPLEP